jgi:hypothetical protein
MGTTSRWRATAGSLLASAAMALTAMAVPAQAAETLPPAPANDTIASAQPIRSLPTTLQGTTVGATTEPSEPESSCQGGTTASVWYSLRFSQAQRIAVELTAGGKLEATVDIYHAVRSQLQSVTCQQTDTQGAASLSFKAAKNGLYYIRVAAIKNSQLAGFSLVTYLPTPAIPPPGRPLRSSGTTGQVDRVQNVNAAYYFTMHSGVSYLINLSNQTKGACIHGALFGPDATSFESGAVTHIRCSGYRLFTPGPGQGGRYSFEVTPDQSYKRIQRFHLQVAVAGRAETAPGLELGNYVHAHGRLDSAGVAVLRLYRMVVTSHSNLTLKLLGPDSAEFNLQLRNQDGRVIECQCGGGGSQTLTHQLQPGTYYAVVSTHGQTAGDYTLIRESRTITATSVSFSQSKITAGQGTAIEVKVTPEASGPVTLEVQRFDPVFGWQFYRQLQVTVSGGAASASFTPPAVGNWRVNATYAGSRTFSPSSVGFSYLLVA